MQKSILTALAISASLILGACNPAPTVTVTSDPPTGTVAVINLDEVAQRLGRSDTIVEALKVKETSLNQQLAEIQQNLVDQVKEAQSGAGETPSEEDATRIEALAQEASLRLNQSRQIAISELSRERQKLVARFREEVRPYAREIAADRGMTIVIPHDESLIVSLDPKANITDEVVAAMIKDDRSGPESTSLDDDSTADEDGADAASEAETTPETAG